MRLIAHGLAIWKKHKPDCIVSFDPLTLGVVAAVLKCITRSRLVIEINGHLKDAQAASLSDSKFALFKRLIYNFTCNMTLSMTNAVKILNKLQFKEWHDILHRKPCFLFHDYVPIKLLGPSTDSGRSILFAGHPFYLKGVDTLIEAFTRVKPSNPDVSLRILGYCPPSELPYWNSMAAKCPGIDIIAPVYFHDMLHYYQDALFVVLPSRTEGMGRVLIEAMACGKATIGSNVGGIPNVIRDGYTGLLFEPCDANDLANKMKLLLDDDNLRRTMGSNAINLANSLFSEHMYCKHYVSMIEKALSNDEQNDTGIVLNGFTDNT